MRTLLVIRFLVGAGVLLGTLFCGLILLAMQPVQLDWDYTISFSIFLAGIGILVLLVTAKNAMAWVGVALGKL